MQYINKYIKKYNNELYIYKKTICGYHWHKFNDNDDYIQNIAEQLENNYYYDDNILIFKKGLIFDIRDLRIKYGDSKYFNYHMYHFNINSIEITEDKLNKCLTFYQELDETKLFFLDLTITTVFNVPLYFLKHDPTKYKLKESYEQLYDLFLLYQRIILKGVNIFEVLHLTGISFSDLIYYFIIYRIKWIKLHNNPMFLKLPQNCDIRFELIN